MKKETINVEEIILLKKINGKTYPNEYSYLKGNILKSELREYKDMNGNTYVEQIYTIQCDNGEIYNAVYGNTINGYCIKTPKDYLIYINKIIKMRKEKIKLLEDEIDILINLRTYLEQNNNSKTR